MPSQDLLFPILPRAPATPSPDDIKREVTQVSQKHKLRKTSADGGGDGSQQQPDPRAKHDQSVVKDDDHKPDPEHKIDIFV
ncbi:hypothetical protein [Aeromonas tecta]|uniref:hypothetical protein n=1 Tax=Aeromonas tecta TaxID=324617 RepID=UPI0006834765|nr:hypothetical protein [Aeromonas tecta]